MIIKRYYWLDILKIIACFFVLTNHTIGYLFEYSGKTQSTSLVYCIAFSMCKVGVPIFIMVTGYLLLSKGFIDSYRSILKKIFRIVVPLLVLSLLIYVKGVGIRSFNILNFLNSLISKPITLSYWYLYMLIGLYLVTPFIQKMLKNFDIKDYKVLMILFLIIPSVIPILSIGFGLDVSNYFSLAVFPISIGLYITGIYLSKIKLCKRNLFIALGYYIVFTILLILLMYLPFVNTGKISYAFDSWNIITTVIPSLSLFYIIRYFFENKKMKKNMCKCIEQVSLVTFGIYLIHTLINYKIYYLSFIQNIFAFNWCIGILSLEVLCFIVCGIIIFIMRKLPLVKKFL